MYKFGLVGVLEKKKKTNKTNNKNAHLNFYVNLNMHCRQMDVLWFILLISKLWEFVVLMIRQLHIESSLELILLKFMLFNKWSNAKFKKNNKKLEDLWNLTSIYSIW